MVKYTSGYTATGQQERLVNLNLSNADQCVGRYKECSNLGNSHLWSKEWKSLRRTLSTQLETIFLEGAMGGGPRLIRMLQRMEARFKVDPEDRRRETRYSLNGDRAGQVKQSLEHVLKSFHLGRNSREQRRERRFFKDRGSIGKVWWMLEYVEHNPMEITFAYTLNVDVQLPSSMKPEGWEDTSEVTFGGGWPCVWRTCDIRTGRLDIDASFDLTSHAGTMSAERDGTTSASTGSQETKGIKRKGIFIRGGEGFQGIYDAWRGKSSPNQDEMSTDDEKLAGGAETKPKPRFSHKKALGFLADVMDPAVENAQRHKISRARRHVADLLTAISSDESLDPSKDTSSLLSSVWYGGKNWVKHAERHPYGLVRKPPKRVDSLVDPSGEAPLDEKPSENDEETDTRSQAGSDRSEDSEIRTKKKRFSFFRRRPKPPPEEGSDTESEGAQRPRRRLRRRLSQELDWRDSTHRDVDVQSKRTLDDRDVLTRPDSAYATLPPSTYPGQQPSGTIETTKSGATGSDLNAQLQKTLKAIGKNKVDTQKEWDAAGASEAWEQQCTAWGRLYDKQRELESSLRDLERRNILAATSSTIGTQPDSSQQSGPASSGITGPSM